ncbi:MAG: transglutaminase family protein [Bacteroidales bacterium]|nr:transglutaminase family protein [Bacteroidales bacterium]
MNKYQVSYITDNYYSQPVHKAVLEFMVLPEKTSSQNYYDLKIENSLGINAQFSHSLFNANLLRFNLQKPFSAFGMKVSFTVEKEVINPFDFIELSCELENKMLHELTFMISNHNFLSLSRYTTPEKQDIPCIIMRQRNEPVFMYLQRLNTFVNGFLKYQTNSTTTQTMIDDILLHRKGVCQDFAHLFICLARISGIPARYVSGYLDQGSDLAGSAALHAWAEALIPGIGWIGFDPANRLVANEHYIKIAHGVDYADCMPIKGVLQFAGESNTNYFVNVKMKNELNYIQNQVQSQ